MLLHRSMLMDRNTGGWRLLTKTVCRMYMYKKAVSLYDWHRYLSFSSDNGGKSEKNWRCPDCVVFVFVLLIRESATLKHYNQHYLNLIMRQKPAIQHSNANPPFLESPLANEYGCLVDALTDSWYEWIMWIINDWRRWILLYGRYSQQGSICSSSIIFFFCLSISVHVNATALSVLVTKPVNPPVFAQVDYTELKVHVWLLKLFFSVDMLKEGLFFIINVMKLQ